VSALPVGEAVEARIRDVSDTGEVRLELPDGELRTVRIPVERVATLRRLILRARELALPPIHKPAA
jgi:hypothetical protein